MRVTQGTFSYLPEFTDEEIEAQIRYALDNGWAIMFEYTDDPHPRNSLWDMWRQPNFDLEPEDAGEALKDLQACRETYPNHYIKVVAYDSSLGRQTSALSFIVNRPDHEPGYRLERTETHDRTINYTLTAYALDDPPGRRYGNEGSLSVGRHLGTVQEGVPGPDSPKFAQTGDGDGDGDSDLEAASDEGAGES